MYFEKLSTGSSKFFEIDCITYGTEVSNTWVCGIFNKIFFFKTFALTPKGNKLELYICFIGSLLYKLW